VTPAATIVITTRNRQELLAKCLRAALQQSALCRIIVVDDASEDGTTEMLRDEFPTVHHLRSNLPIGPCAQRNRGVGLAETEIVFLIDDDTELVSPATVEQTLNEFNHPLVSAVAIPFVNVLQDQAVHTSAPDREQVYVGYAFVAAAHAVKRAEFLAVGGYREPLFYMGEESDFCLRLLAAGRVTRWGAADKVHHFQPPGRISWAADYYGRRNDVLFSWQNVPFPEVLVRLPATLLNGLLHGLRTKRIRVTMQGQTAGLRYCMTNPRIRSAVPRWAYRLFRRLRKLSPIELADLMTDRHFSAAANGSHIGEAAPHQAWSIPH